MQNRLPLPALLSQILVAFVIEFDNEFERQVPHRTTNHGSTGGPGRVPWLVSMAMWLHFLRFVPEQGVPLPEFIERATLSKQEAKHWLTRLSRWWGYLTLTPDGVVMPTLGGKRALRVWHGLSDAIETRWTERFGAAAVRDLRSALNAVLDGLQRELPDFLPILGVDLFCHPNAVPKSPRPDSDSLPVLLAKVLLALASDFEQETRIPLALGANLLRLLPSGSVRARDLPRLTGVSREAVAFLLKRAEKSAYITVGPSRTVTLTSLGAQACDQYASSIAEIETSLERSVGKKVVAGLDAAIEGFPAPQLLGALENYPQGWRAALSAPETLPHFPMMLHRGGFPDGS